MIKEFLLIFGVLSCWIRPVISHGRLWTPPGRSTMFRFKKYNALLPNYNDMELNCGGFQVKLGYKCGLCGDPYDGVRENETGGKYATGTITGTYTQGQRVTLVVDLTAPHKGWFEFKICPRSSPQVKESQECFDSYVLPLTDGSGTKYYPGPESRKINVEVVLPANLTCYFCVLQWRYHTGNSWGTDSDGRSGLGRGYQEEFYACADIRILPSGSGRGGVDNAGRPPMSAVQAKPRPENLNDCRGSARGSGVYAGVRGMDEWCMINCARGHCPPMHCKC